MESRDRVCEVCDSDIEVKEEVFVWKGIFFLDICPSLDCRKQFINELEGEAE